jgi:hypothetical protein
MPRCDRQDDREITKRHVRGRARGGKRTALVRDAGNLTYTGDGSHWLGPTPGFT